MGGKYGATGHLFDTKPDEVFTGSETSVPVMVIKLLQTQYQQSSSVVALALVNIQVNSGESNSGLEQGS